MDFLRSAIKRVVQEYLEKWISDKSYFQLWNTKCELKNATAQNIIDTNRRCICWVRLKINAYEGTCKDWNSEQVSQHIHLWKWISELLVCLFLQILVFYLAISLSFSPEFNQHTFSYDGILKKNVNQFYLDFYPLIKHMRYHHVWLDNSNEWRERDRFKPAQSSPTMTVPRIPFG